MGASHSYVILKFAFIYFRSSYPEVFLAKGVLKIRSSFTGEHPHRRVISVKLLQRYWNHTSAWVFSYKFATYFQNTFFEEHISGRLLLVFVTTPLCFLEKNTLFWKNATIIYFKDVNECESKPCQQKCQNTPGSYKCYCEPGYKKTVGDPKDARCSGKRAFSEVKVNESYKRCCFFVKSNHQLRCFFNLLDKSRV